MVVGLFGCGYKILPAGGLELPPDGYAYLLEYPSTDEGNYVVGQIREGYAESLSYRMFTLLNCRAGVGYYVSGGKDAEDGDEILGKYDPKANAARSPSELEKKISELRELGVLSDIVEAAHRFQKVGFHLQFFSRSRNMDGFDAYDTEYRSCKYHYGISKMNWEEPRADGLLTPSPQTINEIANLLRARLR